METSLHDFEQELKLPAEAQPRIARNGDLDTLDYCLTNRRFVRPFRYGNTQNLALYARVSTSDRGQTVENQLQPLQ